MKKNNIKQMITAAAVCTLLLGGCAADTTPATPTAAPTKPADLTIAPTVPTAPTTEPSGEVSDTALSLSETLTYTEVPNQNSSVSIQYPIFSGQGSDELNAVVLKKVKSLATIDTDYFDADTSLTLDLQYSVTLLNDKVVSIVFWGSTYLEASAYPTTNLYTINLNLATMEELSLSDAYRIDEEFTSTFFEKSYFPTAPVTSYDETVFAEMLALQKDFSMVEDVYTIPSDTTFFLKPDSLVLSFPSIHATGSDHFEAQLNYEDITAFQNPDSLLH